MPNSTFQRSFAIATLAELCVNEKARQGKDGKRKKLKCIDLIRNVCGKNGRLKASQVKQEGVGKVKRMCLA
jgi:hypothetical protein